MELSRVLESGGRKKKVRSTRFNAETNWTCRGPCMHASATNPIKWMCSARVYVTDIACILALIIAFNKPQTVVECKSGRGEQLNIKNTLLTRLNVCHWLIPALDRSALMELIFAADQYWPCCFSDDELIESKAATKLLSVRHQWNQL